MYITSSFGALSNATADGVRKEPYAMLSAVLDALDTLVQPREVLEARKQVKQQYDMLRYQRKCYLQTERATMRDVIAQLKQMEEEIAEANLALTPSRHVAAEALQATIQRIRQNLATQ